MGAAARNNPFGKWKKDEGVSQFKVYDRFGREIRRGDLIQLVNPELIQWRVMSLKPVLAGQKMGSVQVYLTAVWANAINGGVPLGDAIKLVDASEFPPDQQLPPEDGQQQEERPPMEQIGDPPSEPTEPPPSQSGESRIILP